MLSEPIMALQVLVDKDSSLSLSPSACICERDEGKAVLLKLLYCFLASFDGIGSFMEDAGDIKHESWKSTFPHHRVG
jgi:hypothetical protein